MSIRCKHVQEALTSDSHEQLADDLLLQGHLESCPACSELKTALSMLDETMASLGPVEPTEGLVDAFLAGLEPETAEPEQQAIIDFGEKRAERLAEGNKESMWGRSLSVGSMVAAAAGLLVVAATGLSSGPDSSVSSLVDPSDVGVVASLSTETSNGVDFRDSSKLSKEVKERNYKTPADEPHAPSGALAAIIVVEEKEPEKSEDSSISFSYSDSLEDNYIVDGTPTVTADVAGKRAQLAQDIVGNTGVLGVLTRSNLEFEVAKPEEQRAEEGRHNARFRSRIETEKHREGQDKGQSKMGWAFDRGSEDGKILSGKDGRDSDRYWPQSGEFAQDTDKKLSPRKATEQDTKLDEASNQRGFDSNHEVTKNNSHGVVPVAKPVVQNQAMPRFAAQEGKGRGKLSKKKANGVEVTSRRVSGVSGKLSETQKQLAQAFVEMRSTVDGVPTIAPSGFWANRYIPGDPSLRLLEARLEQSPSASQLGPLGDVVNPYASELDAPRNSALAVSVRSDRRASEGPSRMLIQVGIKGTKRQAGRRPALNIGVVLDLANASDEAEASMRAVVAAMRSAKRAGDNFSLTVANGTGGQVVAPSQFRNGPIRVALDKLFAAEASEGPQFDLPEAIEAAARQVGSDDDPNAPLGRSMILLVTASSSAQQIQQQVASITHANAAKGIGLSTIGLGTQVDDAQLLGWAGVGQGNRQLVLQASEAKAAVKKEFASAESVVARAVRLQVRLAPGTKLVEVVGAERLNAVQAHRTREAEKSTDRRIAKAQGIQTNREQDEDGIKIIIPRFLAGDSHVVLLDVIAEGPGAIADVTVSYKDLVHLRNGEAKTSLSLARGRNRTSALTRGVFRNYVGQVVAKKFEEAGALLSSENHSEAAHVLARLQDLLSALPSHHPWLSKDVAYSNDLQVVQRFRELLQNGLADANKRYVADSLTYAAWRKRVPLVRARP